MAKTGIMKIAIRRGPRNDNNGLSWLLSNHQGSPTDTLDPDSGQPLTNMRFTAWGQTRLTSGPVDEDRMLAQQLSPSPSSKLAQNLL